METRGDPGREVIFSEMKVNRADWPPGFLKRDDEVVVEPWLLMHPRRLLELPLTCCCFGMLAVPRQGADDIRIGIPLVHCLAVRLLELTEQQPIRCEGDPVVHLVSPPCRVVPPQLGLRCS